jgi:hypothetical protein
MHRWLLRKLFWPGVFALTCLGVARATSVVPPSFPELVSEAQVIVRARVESVRCAWVETPQGRAIKTFVTLAVQKRLKGEAPAEIVLQLLGGEIDGQGMRVEGMPRFAVGRTEILFIADNGVQFCPLVGMMHGRYHVQTEPATGRDYVARDDGVPLENEQQVQVPQGTGTVADRALSPTGALTPEAFEEKIAAEVGRHALP